MDPTSSQPQQQQSLQQQSRVDGNDSSPTSVDKGLDWLRLRHYANLGARRGMVSSDADSKKRLPRDDDATNVAPWWEDSDFEDDYDYSFLYRLKKMRGPNQPRKPSNNSNNSSEAAPVYRFPVPSKTVAPLQPSTQNPPGGAATATSQP